jgi:hypothetical protein
MLKSGTAGGAAAAGGFSFQDSVAALVAVDLLAEQGATPRWGLDPTITYRELRCETGLPVDDIMVVTSAGGAVYAQVKRNITLSANAESALGSVIDQFVRHFLSQRSLPDGKDPWERALDENRDRLVLVTDGNAPQWATVHLPALLDRFRRDLRWTSLIDAAKNIDEKTAAERFLEHGRSSWRRLTGNEPSSGNLRELLALIRIDCVDVRIDGVGGRDDLVAMDKLRQVVLESPSDAEAAYAFVKDYCRTLVVTRNGTDRAELQRELIRKNVAVRPAIGSDPDRSRLRNRTRLTLSQAEELSVIEMGGNSIKVERPVVSALIEAVKDAPGDCLVIGEPGAGKSGVLHDAVSRMLANGWDVIFLAADVLGADHNGDLRQDLGIDDDLFSLIEQWEGSTPGVLVIDALDAARADRASRVLRALIGQVVRLKGRWRVIGSIREFDLRCSGEWQDAFRGTPPAPEFCHELFRNVRHLKIPLLDEAELEQVARQSQELGSLVSTTKGLPLHDLLRQMFNLRLAAALLSDGLTVEELSPLRAQVELLDQYWDRRVLGQDADSYRRQAAVYSICELMIERQSLRLQTNSDRLTAFAKELDQLLRQGVLSEHGPTTFSGRRGDWIAFNHHVLFDYAVARALLRVSTSALIERLKSPESVLIVRPSLLLHFEHLWLSDQARREFWSTTQALNQSGEVTAIAKLVASEVSTESAKSLTDLEPLLADLRSPDQGQRETAGRIVAHIVGSLLASHVDLAHEKHLLWYQWAERVSACMFDAVVGPLASLLGHWLPKMSQMTDRQTELIAPIAGRLLEFAERDAWSRRWIYPVAIASACRTLSASSAEGRGALESLLQPANIDADRVDALLRIAMEVKSMAAVEPELAERVYVAISQVDEVPDQRIPLGQSRILSMNVSTRDEFKVAEWNLAEAFPGLLGAHPASALRALAAALEGHVRHENYHTEGNVSQSMSFRGRQVHFAEDSSFIWDEGSLRQDEGPVRMVSALEVYATEIAIERPDELGGLLDLVTETQSRAIVWRRLLRAGASQPDPLGRQLAPLLESEPILLSHSTTYTAGMLLQRLFPMLEEPKRSSVEAAILALVQQKPAGDPDGNWRQSVRDRLLRCLSIELAGDETRALLEKMETTDPDYGNESPFRISFQYSEVPERESWERSGIAYESSDATEYRRLSNPLADFTRKYRNELSSLDAVKQILPSIREVANFLWDRPSEVPAKELTSMALDTLAECVEIVCRTDYEADNAGFVALARDILIRASRDELPLATNVDQSQFDSFPSWGTPAPRIVAAKGLLIMSRNRRTYSVEIGDAIQVLSRDPVPAVRYMIASYLQNLGRVEQELMWRLIEKFANDDPSTAVRFALVSGTVESVLAMDTVDRVTKILDVILAATPPAGRDRSHDPRKQSLGILLRIYLSLDDARCREQLFRVAREPVGNAADLVYLCGIIRDALDERFKPESDPRRVAATGRAWAWVNEVCRAAVEALKVCRVGLIDTRDGRKQADAETYKLLAWLIESATMNIYFASGAHDAQKGTVARPIIGPGDYRQRFFRQASPALQCLADATLARASHYLIETLRFLMEADPAEVFLLVGDVVNKSTADAYHYEPLAADLIVGLVERYLADYRELFVENRECQRVLVQLLETFVGWPNARRLAFRLGEVFR